MMIRIAFSLLLFFCPIFSLAEVTVGGLLQFQPDEDGNGVRDDVDKHIQESFPDSAEKIKVATSYAWALQRVAQNEAVPAEARRMALHMRAIQHCSVLYFPNGVEGLVLPRVLNTYGVSRSYLTSQMVWSKSLPAISDDEVSQFIEQELAGICP